MSSHIHHVLLIVKESNCVNQHGNNQIVVAVVVFFSMLVITHVVGLQQLQSGDRIEMTKVGLVVLVSSQDY